MKLENREIGLAASKSVRTLVLFGLALSGAAALIYEVVWTRALSLTLGSTTYALSTMLAAFMAGLSLGGYLGGRFADRQKKLVRTFAHLEIGIALFGMLTLLAVNNISAVYAWIFYQFNISSFLYNWAQFVLSFSLMLIPTTLMGATFPIVLKIYTQSFETLAKSGGSVYSINSIGAVCGALAAGFLLIPLLGVKGANLAAAGLNFAVALLLLFPFSSARKLFILFLGIISLLFIFSFSNRSFMLPFNYYLARQFTSYNDYLNSIKGIKLVFTEEDIQGKVQVFERDLSGVLYLVASGKIESSLGIDLRTILLLSYLPLAYFPEAKTFLNIGLGTGTTVKAALQDENSLELIESVEINQAILKAAELYFYPDLFNSPKVRHIIADARNYLTLTTRKYDIISSEPSYPSDGSVSHLFTVEFFQLVKSKLTEDGVFAQWIPIHLLDHPDRFIFNRNVSIMVKSFASVFPQAYGWNLGGDIILVGLKDEKKAIHPSEIQESVNNKLNRFCAWINENKPSKVDCRQLRSEYAFGVGPEKIQKIVQDKLIPVNTDNRPRLEFAVAQSLLYQIGKEKRQEGNR